MFLIFNCWFGLPFTYHLCVAYSERRIPLFILRVYVCFFLNIKPPYKNSLNLYVPSEYISSFTSLKMRKTDVALTLAARKPGRGNTKLSNGSLSLLQSMLGKMEGGLTIEFLRWNFDFTAESSGTPWLCSIFRNLLSTACSNSQILKFSHLHRLVEILVLKYQLPPTESSMVNFFGIL